MFSWLWFDIRFELRLLVSHGSGPFATEDVGLNKLLDTAAVTSSPVVKARSPAPERMIARQEGLCESWDRRGGNSSHMLEV